MSKVDLKVREAEAAAARAKFVGTLQELQHRLSPQSIVNDVKETVKEKADGAMSAAKDGVVQAATHPSTVAAVTVPVLVYLFRKPLARALRAVFPHAADEEPELQPYEAARMPVPATKSTHARAASRDAAFTEQGA